MRIVLACLFLLTTAVAIFAQDPVKVDPTHYRVLFENEHTRVLEYRDKTGDKAPMHSHPAYMTYATAAGKTKVMLPSGEVEINERGAANLPATLQLSMQRRIWGAQTRRKVVFEFKDVVNPCSSPTECRDVSPVELLDPPRWQRRGESDFSLDARADVL